MGTSHSKQSVGDADPCSWETLPALAVDKCVRALAASGHWHDLARLSVCCKSLRDAIYQEPELWRMAIVSRFGGKYLPAVAPSGPVEPQQLPGWVFYPGAIVHAFGDPGHAVYELAEAAAAEGAEAFTTKGRIYGQVPPADRWSRRGFHPAHGMYVHHAAVEREGLPLPPAVPAAVWPPQSVPGWQYIPGVKRVDQFSPIAYLKWYHQPGIYPELEQILATAGDCIVTTEGGTCDSWKAWPPSAWVRCADPCKGVYVPQALFQALHPLPRWLTLTLAAVEHPEDPDAAAALLRHRYQELSQLRLHPNQLRQCVERGMIHYEEETTSPTGQVIVLSTVSWQHPEGNIVGVMPGVYEVVWHMGLVPPYHEPYAVKLTAQVTAQQQDGEEVLDAVGTRTATKVVRVRPGWQDSPPQQGQFDPSRWTLQGSGSWLQLSGGIIRVDRLSTVDLMYEEVPWSFGPFFESGIKRSDMALAYVELVPYQQPRLWASWLRGALQLGQVVGDWLQLLWRLGGMALGTFPMPALFLVYLLVAAHKQALGRLLTSGDGLWSLL